MKAYLKRTGPRLLPSLAALVAVLLLQFIGFQAVDRFGLLTFDYYQKIKPREYQDAPVRIVDIDDETIRRLGQWPWPRMDVAELTNRLADAGAAAIAFDIVFAEKDRTSPARVAEQMEQRGVDANTLAALRAMPDNDNVLAATFQKTPAVLGFFLTRDPEATKVIPKAGFTVLGSAPNQGVVGYSGAIQPLEPLRDAAPGLGFVSLTNDSDGIVRKAQLVAAQGDQLLPSLSLEALRTAQGAGSIVVKSNDASGEIGGAGAQIVALKVGDFEIPTTSAGELWMYFTEPRQERTVPAWKILTGALAPAEMERLFAGHIIFIGTGAIGLRDLVSTPIRERELGVMVHAQAAEQAITGQFLIRPDWGLGLERALLLVTGIVLAFALPALGAARGAVLGLAMIAGTIWGSWEAFRQYQFLLDPTYPALGLLAIYLCATMVNYYREERQHAYIHQAFDRYLSPALVKRIVDDPGQLTLGGEERDMTVLFCDIRSFSSISENLGPQEIIRFLIAFLTPMCDILLDRKATIDKFIGDAILAFWNAPLDDPDQHANAARAALEMVKRLDQLNIDMPKNGTEPWPGKVKIGIGLNAGTCCVGNMGSAQRLSYSLIGDTVNLASRIEGLTKFYDVKIAIGQQLQRQIENFAVVPMDLVRVVGRDAPEMVFALVGDEEFAATPAFTAFAASHQNMRAAYSAQLWDVAAEHLAHANDAAAGFGLGQLYTMMNERIAHYRAHPPGDEWDGVFQALEK